MEGTESQADHERAGNRDRRSKSGTAFDERAEAEGHEQHLQALVISDASNRALHDLEFAGLD